MITGNEPVTAIEGPEQGYSYSGLTIRQHFASMAMQGMIVQNVHVDRVINEVSEKSLVNQIAIASVKMADALITELNRKP